MPTRVTNGRLSSAGARPLGWGVADSRSCRHRLLDDRVILPAALRLVARVRDQPLDLSQSCTVGGAGGRNDVLLHHEAAVVVRTKSQGYLTHLVAHGDPGRLNVRHVAEYDPRDREGTQIGHGVRLPVMRHAG